MRATQEAERVGSGWVLRKGSSKAKNTEVIRVSRELRPET